MKKDSFIRDLLEVVISVAIITFVIVNFILMPCQVVGTSMYPNLHDEDVGFSLLFTKKLGIKRFDICVIDDDNVSGDHLLVKRVIGLPGETVEYKDSKLFINGEYMDEYFLSGVTTNDLSITLGEDEYYCLGDNREVSKDSRYYGPFDSEQILATKFIVISPFDNFGVKK